LYAAVAFTVERGKRQNGDRYLLHEDVQDNVSHCSEQLCQSDVAAISPVLF
jgi:hypothetical protein